MSKKRKGEPISGWVNLDKPIGITSTQAIAKLRYLLKADKIGHAGTLDPLATGVLPIALGEATKTIPFAQDALKTYSFTIAWGEQRDTDDAEGEIIATSDIRPTREQITPLLSKYTGEIEQIPPLYSAIKIDGRRAYDLARDGEKPELKARTVYVETLHIEDHSRDETSFLMICGKGTYVRSLARDMAEDLGTKGHIKTLRREQVGSFTAKDAISLDMLENMDYKTARTEALLPLQTVLDDIPALALTQTEANHLKQGKRLNLISRPDFERLTKAGLGTQETRTALAHLKDEPIALVESRGAEIRPLRVFNT